MRLSLGPKWLPAGLFVVGWASGWFAAWQLYLFELLSLDPAPGLTLFVNERSEQRSLWVGVGTALVLGSLGVFFLVYSRIFRRSQAARWRCLFLGSGVAFTLVGLSATILFPSTTTLVIDEQAEVVRIEQRWLYAGTTEALLFDDIERIGLRVFRTRLTAGTATACQTVTAASIIRHDKTWLEVPGGFDHEAVANSIVEIANVPLDAYGVRQC